MVLTIGDHTGILSLLAVSAGCAHVYMIYAYPSNLLVLYNLV